MSYIKNKNQSKQSTFKELKVVAILLVLVVIPVTTSLPFSEKQAITTPISSDTLDGLSKEYRSRGLKGFLDAKKRLRKQVSYQLDNDENPKAQMAALNIAVYFFPDLLPDNHLEKPFAEENLVPLQTRIEEGPGTSQARYYFQELRSLVWNYENPENNEQGLSEHAEKMLQVYGSLSWK